jgi:hypothetical protein
MFLLDIRIISLGYLYGDANKYALIVTIVPTLSNSRLKCRLLVAWNLPISYTYAHDVYQITMRDSVTQSGGKTDG